MIELLFFWTPTWQRALQLFVDLLLTGTEDLDLAAEGLPEGQVSGGWGRSERVVGQSFCTRTGGHRLTGNCNTATRLLGKTGGHWTPAGGQWSPVRKLHSWLSADDKRRQESLFCFTPLVSSLSVSMSAWLSSC